MEKNNRRPYPEPDSGKVDNPEVSHEASDVSIPGIVKFGVGLTVVAIIVHVAMWVLFDYFAERQNSAQPVPSSLVYGGRDRLPPEPRLQGAPGHEIHPVEELNSMRTQENELLSTYGWVEKGRGIARIPITQAITLLAEKGLPARPNQKGSEDSLPQESSSARTSRRKP